jgi:hypothetical protein
VRLLRDPGKRSSAAEEKGAPNSSFLEEGSTNWYLIRRDRWERNPCRRRKHPRLELPRLGLGLGLGLGFGLGFGLGCRGRKVGEAVESHGEGENIYTACGRGEPSPG